LIFGEYKYAVWDIDAQLLEAGNTEHETQFVLLEAGYVVVVNRFEIGTGVIVP
jgi:hypothetical protein